VSSLGCSTRLLVGVLVIVLIFFIIGFIFGEIGQSLFGIDEPPSWISVGQPHVELPAESIMSEPLFSLGSLGDFYLTNTLIAALLTIVVVVGLFFAATRKMKIVPGRLQNLVEAGLELLLNFVESVAGKENGRRFFPIVATIFIFVIFNAYLALIPLFGPGITAGEHEESHALSAGTVEIVKIEEGDRVEEGEIIYILDTGEEIAAPINGEVEHLLHVGDSVAANESVASIDNHWPLFRSANTDLNMPLALALVSFVFVEFWGMRVIGRRRYLSTTFFNFGLLFRSIRQLFKGKVRTAFSGIITGFIEVFVGMLELLSHFVRLISFTFRLFGNMLAGEILLIIAVFLVPWVMAIPFYGLELLVGFVQALIFAGLTLVFVVIAVAPHEEEGH
jgi:F0F1-type ATP synthase membrane subunit a